MTLPLRADLWVSADVPDQFYYPTDKFKDYYGGSALGKYKTSPIPKQQIRLPKGWGALLTSVIKGTRNREPTPHDVPLFPLTKHLFAKEYRD